MNAIYQSKNIKIYKMKKSHIFQFFLLLSLLNVNAQINFLNNKVINGTDCNGSYTYESVPIDIDSDGDLDIISASSNGLVGWYENLDGLGNFGYMKKISNQLTLSFSNKVNLIVKDVDNDLDVDVLINCESSTGANSDLLLYKNQGLGVFSDEIMIATEIVINLIDTADINNDGYIDILVTNSNSLKWYKNLNGQNWSLPITIMNAPIKAFDAKDVDSDGDNDIVVYTRQGNSNNSNIDNKIILIKNSNGQGTFGTPVTLNSIINTIINGSASNFSMNVYFQDIDNDLDTDIVFFLEDEIYTITNTDGIGLFGSAVLITNPLTFGTRIYQLRFNDYDDDGDLDFIIAFKAYFANGYSKRYMWFEKNNQILNSYTQHILLDDSLDQFPYAFEIIDIDGDGIKDLLASDSSDITSSLTWYKSCITRTPITTICTQNAYARAVDLDNDGDKDIISYVGAYDYRMFLFENIDGLGNMGLQKQIIFDDYAIHFSYGNIDSDEFIDILGITKWQKNNGNENFTSHSFTNGIGNNVINSIADVDNDGYNDIISGISIYNGGSIGWYKNLDGEGNFGPLQMVGTFTGADEKVRKVIFEDIDGDNNKDFIVLTKSDVRIIKAINNTGSFGSLSSSIHSYPCNCDNLFLFANDIDEDNDLDLIFAKQDIGNSFGLGGINFKKNNGFGVFTNGQSIPNSSVYSKLFPSDIDNDGDIDIIGTNYENFRTVFYENLDGLGNYNNSPVTLIEHQTGNNSTCEPFDIDNDGNKDFLHSSVNFSWFKNLGLSNNKVKGNIKLDIDNNGCSSTDNPMQNVRVINSLNTTIEKSTLTNNSGYYQFYIANPGTYSTVVSSTLPSYFTASPSSHTNTFLTNDTLQTSDFCILSSQTINNLEIVIYQLSESRPGFKASYVLSYRNVGTTMKTGSVNLQYENSKISFFSSIPNISSQLSNELVFNYANLYPTETRNINIIFNVLPPPTVNIDDILNFTATIYPIENDAVPNDNTYNMSQVVIGSFDPNDINVIEGNSIYSNQIDDYLHYIIRFQNTGTASAINVRINNVLDDNLDWNTIQIDGSSHSYTNEIVNGKNVAFIFDNIFLPSSSTNEIGSQGYIAYKIKPKNNSQVGDVFTNNADIYFDYNLPIRTNTVNTEVIENLAINQFENASINLYPNPTNGKLTIDSKTDISSIILTNIYGQNVMEITNTNEINISGFNNGIYFIKIKDKTGTVFIKKVIKN